YGVLAGAYSTWLIGFILLNLGAFLTRRYEGWGAVVFGGLLIVLFRNPLRKTVGWLASLFIGKQAIVVRMKRLARLVIPFLIAGAALYFIKTDFRSLANSEFFRFIMRRSVRR